MLPDVFLYIVDAVVDAVVVVGAEMTCFFLFQGRRISPQARPSPRLQTGKKSFGEAERNLPKRAGYS